MRLFTRASVAALVAGGIAIVGACGSDEEESAPSNGGGCGEPGTACTKNEECCQRCLCKGSQTTITLRSCAITTTKLCLPCDDFCGQKVWKCRINAQGVEVDLA